MEKLSNPSLWIACINSMKKPQTYLVYNILAGVQYMIQVFDTWKWPHSVILEKEGPNDGLVSVESSKWGIYLGTLSQVNHLDLVGWINTARYKWAEIMGKEIKFRPATFYLGIVDMLAREVEGQEQEQNQVDHEDGEIGKPKVGPDVELEEYPGKSPAEENHTATSLCRSKPDLIPPLSKEGTIS